MILIVLSEIMAQDPLIETGFETDPFTEGWIQQSSGAGWLRQSAFDNYFAVNTGFYGMVHLDDVGEQDDWLISPDIDVPDDNSTILSFWESSLFSSYILMHEVCVSYDGGMNWTRISSTVPSESEFKKIVLPLPDLAGQKINIGWHYTGDYSDQWFIDDVRMVYDDQPPVVSSLQGDVSLLPIIGTYESNDMYLKISLYDRSLISVVKGFYSFEGDSALTAIDFSATGDRFVFVGTVPARDSVSEGIIRFNLEDEFGNSIVTEDFIIEFLYDDHIPAVLNVRGLIALTYAEACIQVTFQDHSNIESCAGHYSRDGFVTQTDIDLLPSKINSFTYSGKVSAETVATDSAGIYFTATDMNGNTASSTTYNMKWIDSYSDLKKFDLRYDLGINYVSTVKEQPNGTCWMYSTCALMESNLLMTGNWAAAGEEGEPDLSEQHMSWWFGFNEFYNADADPVTGDGLVLHLQGGYFLNAAYMLRGEGAVRQTDADDFYEPPERYSEYYHRYYPRNVEWFSMDYELNGIETIKQKVVEFGAAGVTLKHTSYDPFTYIHYQSPEDPTYFSHGVSIIGWDDDKITQAAEGPGAWYCKNSWGEDFGFDGFYWVSYYDKHACRSMSGAVSFQDVEEMKYDEVYYHDYHGYSSVLPGINEAFNAFTVRESGRLSAVSFFNAVNDVDYTVKIYSDFTGGELTGLISETSGHIDFKGYHTIDLVDPPVLYQGNTFYIYLDLSDGGQPIDETSYVQVAYLWYTSKASPGESFYFENGEWKDLYYNTTIASPGTANFCIKGLFQDVSGISESAVPAGTELYQNYPNPFNPSTTISYSIPGNSRVTLNVYNMNGQLVKNLVNKMQQAGYHSVEFNPEELSSGVYFYRLAIDGKAAGIKKMLLVR